MSPQSGSNAPYSPRVSSLRSGRVVGDVVRRWTGNPPSFRSGATRGRRGTVVSQSFPRPTPNPVGEGQLFRRWGRRNGLGKGSGVSFFPQDPGTREGGAACLRLQSRGAWHTATSARSRSSLSCAESGTTRDAICIPPPSFRLARVGVSPAAEACSWQ